MSATLAPSAPVRPDPAVQYRWDPDTGILAARLRTLTDAAPASAPAQLALSGRDGAWVVLELQGDRLVGVDVVVWPAVRTVHDLAAPDGEARGLGWRRVAGAGTVRACTTQIVAEVSGDGRTVHLRLGGRTAARTVRAARDLRVDLDAAGGLAGLWLCNVPPSPEGS